MHSPTFGGERRPVRHPFLRCFATRPDGTPHRVIMWHQHYETYIGCLFGIASRINCVLMHTGSSPSYFFRLVTTTANVPFRKRLRSADTNRYEPLTTRLVFGERCFSHTGPKAWNELFTELQDLTDHSAFRRQLKTFLFESAFSTQWWSCLW